MVTMERAPTAAAILTTPANRVGLRVLVVDDNPDCAESTALLLRIHGHDVEVAPNGPTALEKARSSEPDVVLLDLGLPGMDGFSVARQLSAVRPRKTPLLIAVTGYGRQEDRDHSAKAGIDLHLVKPVEPAHLLAILTRFHMLLCNEPEPASLPGSVANPGKFS